MEKLIRNGNQALDLLELRVSAIGRSALQVKARLYALEEAMRILDPGFRPPILYELTE